jgi:hypothetical protein
MKNFTDLFDFEVRHLDDGSVEILDLCAYPQDSKNCFYLHKHLDLHNIYKSGVEFPINLSHWSVNITPDNEEIIKKYYSLDGIKIILDENIDKLKGEITFFKPEITYFPNSKFPNLIIHFYQLVNVGGVSIIDELDMFENCLIHYQDTKQFTEDRLEELEKLVKVDELHQIPFLPIELIQFDEDKIKEIEQHILAKNACK